MINSDQQGYIQQRNIAFNSSDVLDYAENLQLEAAILFLDFKKAFC